MENSLLDYTLPKKENYYIFDKELTEMINLIIKNPQGNSLIGKNKVPTKKETERFWRKFKTKQ